MRYQRLGIVGVGLLCVLGAVAAFRSTCGTCDGQNISAAGDQSAEDRSEEAAGTDERALVVDGALDAMALDQEALTLFGADSPEEETEKNTEEDADEGEESTTTTAPSTTTTAAGESSTTLGSTTSVQEAATTTTGSSSTTASPSTTVVSTTKVTSASTITTVVSSTVVPTTAAPSTTAPPPPPTTTGGTVPTNGTKIYVNPNGGNDGNNGSSEATALKSFRAAVSRVQPGQTIYLMGGDYWENADPGNVHYNMWNKNGRADAWIKVAALPGHRPVFNASQGIGLLINGDYVEISGIHIKGSGYSASNSSGSGINVGDAHHVRLIGNTVSGFPMSGLSIVRSSNIHVINNVVYNNSFWSERQGSGISFWNSKNHGQGPDGSGYHDLIIGNRVFRNENKVNSWKWPDNQTDGNGIIIDENRDTGYTGKTLIANNLVYDNGGRGIIAYKANNVDIMFNTTYHNARSPQLIGGPVEITTGRSANIRFYHNIAWARSGGPAFKMSAQEMYGPAESKGNIWVTNAPHGDEYKGTNNMVTTSNPGLRNPTTGSGADFRPNYGTSLQGYAGSGFWAVPNDILGTSRGSTAEPGAFEAEAGSGR